MGKSHIHLEMPSEMKSEIQEHAREQGLTQTAFLRQLFLMWKQGLLEQKITLKKPSRKSLG
tara:strand:- start:1185 stop:1367 length:183 start_codon:yes stop_codon:yes gene_type:complete